MSFKVGDKVRLLGLAHLVDKGFKSDGDGGIVRHREGIAELLTKGDLKFMGQIGKVLICKENNKYSVRMNGICIHLIPEDALVKVEDSFDYDFDEDAFFEINKKVELSDQELAEDGAFDLEVSNIDELAVAMKKFEAWVKECKELGIGMLAWDGHVQLSRDNNSISTKF